MISARRAALLGLTVPLSPIMIALLGLWPEPEDDDDLPVSQQVYGGRRRWRGKSPRWLKWPATGRAVGIVAKPQAPRSKEDDEALAEKVRQHWDVIEQSIALREAKPPPPVAVRQAAGPDLAELARAAERQRAADAAAAAAAVESARAALQRRNSQVIAAIMAIEDD